MSAWLVHTTPLLAAVHVINTDFEEGSTVQEVQAIVDHYRKSDTYAQAMEEVEEEPRRLANGGGPSLKLRSLEPSANGVWRQFYALWKRANVDSVRNITNYWLRIAALSMQALVRAARAPHAWQAKPWNICA